MLRGLPCSGKTTAALRLCEETGGVRVSWTEMRQGGASCAEAMLWCASIVRDTLRSGGTAVVDECNLYGPSFFFLQTTGEMEGVHPEWQTVRCGVEECKRRCRESGGNAADEKFIEILALDYLLFE